MSTPGDCPAPPARGRVPRPACPPPLPARRAPQENAHLARSGQQLLQLRKPSAYFYIEGTFFNDLRHPLAEDYSAPIRRYNRRGGAVRQAARAATCCRRPSKGWPLAGSTSGLLVRVAAPPPGAHPGGPSFRLADAGFSHISCRARLPARQLLCREEGIPAPPHPLPGSTRIDVTTTGIPSAAACLAGLEGVSASRQRAVRGWHGDEILRVGLPRLLRGPSCCGPPSTCASPAPSQSSLPPGCRTLLSTRSGCAWALGPAACTATRAVASTCSPSRQGHGHVVPGPSRTGHHCGQYCMDSPPPCTTHSPHHPPPTPPFPCPPQDVRLFDPSCDPPLRLHYPFRLTAPQHTIIRDCEVGPTGARRVRV